ncbi:MAG: Accessory secretory protein Asp4 [Streptococcus salivarius]
MEELKQKPITKKRNQRKKTKELFNHARLVIIIGLIFTLIGLLR